MQNRIVISILFFLATSCSSIPDVENGNNGEQQTKDKWISEVLEYMPAPGQFINEGMGNMASAQKLIGGTSIVSLGSFGGYIIFRFNHDVINGEGDDFVVIGNAYRDAIYTDNNSSEPGIVQVSYDENGNGKPDDKWYELQGVDHDVKDVIKNYEITYKRPDNIDGMEGVAWSDNKGNNGIIGIEDMLSFHKNSMYPLAEFFKDGEIAQTITFKGTLMSSNGVQVNGEEQYWKQSAFGKGYVDNFSSEYEAMVGNDADTKDGNKLDIANAIDENGNIVKLPKITFIKIYSAVLQSCGWLGETSTEVCGAISLRVPKK